MDPLEVLPQENSHLGTSQISSFPLLQVLQELQALMKAGEELGEEGLVPCSKAAPCSEEGEHVQEQEMVQTGALCLVQLGDCPPVPGKFEVVSVIQA